MKRHYYSMHAHNDELGLVATTEMVVDLVKRHSTIFDRLNPKKMASMVSTAESMILGLLRVYPKDRRRKWNFFDEDIVIETLNK